MFESFCFNTVKGAKSITTGERYNLIIWFRDSSLRTKQVHTEHNNHSHSHSHNHAHNHNEENFNHESGKEEK